MTRPLNTPQASPAIKSPSPPNSPSTPTEIVKILTSGTYEKTFDLKTPGESLHIILIYLCKNSDNLKINLKVRHLAPNTHSELLVSGILKDRAKKSCHLTLDFKNGCSGATGVEREDVFLLSNTAKNISLPTIYCSEENVKGSHGASVGHLDKNQLSYLLSRGLSEKTAKNLLSRAVLYKNLKKISDDHLRTSIKNQLDML